MREKKKTLREHVIEKAIWASLLALVSEKGVNVFTQKNDAYVTQKEFVEYKKTQKEKEEKEAVRTGEMADLINILISKL
jgi:hypothetical protein